MSRASSPAADVPRRTLASLIPEPVRNLFPLVLLGAGMLYSDRRFTFIDDETLILDAAAQPVKVTLAAFRTGLGQHEHPPLYDLLLHFWLRLTGGAFVLLRVPAIIFFLLGLWLLSRAAQRLGGEKSATALVWIGALWPYGFHFGRLAGWYSLSFLLISGLTWAYLRYCDSSSPRHWVVVCAFALALVYTNYFGWALLGLLGIDQSIRNRKQPGTVQRLTLTAAALLIGFAPLWRAFATELSGGTNFHQSWKVLILNAGYNVYVLGVSEAMAPWFWRFGIPATIAVASSLLLVFFSIRGGTRRFLIFGALLVAAMAVIGILMTKRLMLVAPWFLLPTAVAVGTLEKRYWRVALAISLVGTAGIGWYGTLVRTYYAAPRFIEPWAELASESAGALREGATVLTNSESYFFYLTYALQAPSSVRPWRFSGVLPDHVHYPQVWGAYRWAAAGRPISSYVLWVRGMSPPSQAQALNEADDWLSHRCGDRVDRYLVRDPGYVWKQRFFPQLGELPWRIEIHQYICAADGANSPAQPHP